MFSIDLFEVNQQAMPPRLRKPVFISFMKSVYRPLITIQALLNEHQKGLVYALNFTGQNIYLEHFLNDKYDPFNRGIYITDAIQNDEIYFPLLAENEPVLFGLILENSPVNLGLISDYETDIDFTVNIPLGVIYNQTIMTADVNQYRTAGKQFLIQTI
jgi:hypothetical protein